MDAVKEKKKYSEADVIIIGAGPAGVMAGIQAAGKGVRTLILERGAEPLLKFLLTARGRCNLTNVAPVREFISKYRPDGRFLFRSLTRFSNDDLIAFFNSIGVKTVSERGRVFPENGDARAVRKALIETLEKTGAGLLLKRHVKNVSYSADEINCFNVECEHGSFKSRTLIIATGGLSYPETGSTGDGFKFARKMGHSITPLKPALVGLETLDNWPRSLPGLSLKNVGLTVTGSGKKLFHDTGEMLFTHHGISGPLVYSASLILANLLDERTLFFPEDTCAFIDLKPALSVPVLAERLRKECESSPSASIVTVLARLMPRSLADALTPMLLAELEKKDEIENAEKREGEKKLESGDEPVLPARLLICRKKAAEKVALFLKKIKLTLRKSRPFAEAVVTLGGVELSEVDPRTLESKKIPGLFFAGEILNLAGETGGFNLQAAFSTGYVAGLSAALRINEKKICRTGSDRCEN